MNKYVVISIFAMVCAVLLRRNRIFIVPILLVVYSNLNGLLDWEDFALRGVVKFQDYGLVLLFFVMFFGLISRKYITNSSNKYESSQLYRLLLVYWGYCCILFIYSVFIQGGVEWPIKMGRTFFYGAIIFLIVKEVGEANPVVEIGRILNALKYFTLVFGLCYVAYNVAGFDIYPTEEYETFSVADVGEVKRNFLGFPVFAFYFLIYFIDKYLSEPRQMAFNLFGLVLMGACIALTLTRGSILAMAVIAIITLLYRVPNVLFFKRFVLMVFSLMLVLPFFAEKGQGQLDVLTMRFGEFVDSGGVAQSGNFLVRASEFSSILNNVLDFNPFFGFGFTNVSELGYQSNLIHGGSADNGFSNLLGIGGFVGLGLFLMVIGSWLVVNIKLQRLKKESIARLNFIFMIYMMASFLNGAYLSYMHNFGLFMIYDLMAYAYLKNRIR